MRKYAGTFLAGFESLELQLLHGLKVLCVARLSRVNYFVRFDDNYDGRLSVKKKHYVFF